MILEDRRYRFAIHLSSLCRIWYPSPLVTMLALTLFVGLAAALPAPASLQRSQKRAGQSPINVELGPRPYYLVDDMDDGPLKEKLESCAENEVTTSQFSISHRGAPLMWVTKRVDREGLAADRLPGSQSTLAKAIWLLPEWVQVRCRRQSASQASIRKWKSYMALLAHLQAQLLRDSAHSPQIFYVDADTI